MDNDTFNSLLQVDGGTEFFESVLGGLAKVEEDIYSLPSDFSDTDSVKSDEYYKVSSSDEEMSPLFNEDDSSSDSDASHEHSEIVVSEYINNNSDSNESVSQFIETVSEENSENKDEAFKDDTVEPDGLTILGSKEQPKLSLLTEDLIKVFREKNNSDPNFKSPFIEDDTVQKVDIKESILSIFGKLQ
ncbi:MAG: hypothetical protein ACRCZI_04715 [Cetobacterium sp.]